MKKMLGGLIILGILLVPSVSLADGMVAPPPNYFINESEQKAVILHDGNQETLVLSITFYGDASNFAWVVPVPSRPEVDKAPDELFENLAELTAVAEEALKAPGLGIGLDQKAGREAVEVLETKKVDIYEVKVLAASDADALAKWLSDNGYRFPEGAGFLLEDYVKNNWYYVAVKVRPEVVSGFVQEKLNTGHATPLKLTFDSKKIVYPLKISAVNQYWEPPVDFEEDAATEYYMRDEVGVLLYVFASKEQRTSRFQNLYSAEVKKEDIEALAFDAAGEPWIRADRNYVLTKLYREMSFSEMTDDLVLQDVAGGLEVGKTKKVATPPWTPPPQKPTWELWLTGAVYFLISLLLWVVSPIGIVFIVATLIYFLARSRVFKIISFVLEGFSVFGWLLVMLTLVLIRFTSTSEELTFLSAGIVAGAVLMLAILITIILEAKRWPQRARRRK